MRRRLLRFGRLSIAALLGRGNGYGRPVPGLAVRVGVAGHVALPERAAITPFIVRILTHLRQAVAAANDAYLASFDRTDADADAGANAGPNAGAHGEAVAGASPRSECRIVSQLAAGADQLVAAEGLRLGYTLQCVLPVELEAYARDLRRNPGVDSDPEAGLRELAAAASAVLELDGVADERTGELTQRTYEISALTMLEHADILIALVRSDAEALPGGTQWLIDEAQRRGVPLIRVVLDAPAASRLVLGPAGARAQQPLEGSGWAENLVSSLALELPRTFGPTDWFERRFHSHVTADETAWPLSPQAPTLVQEPRMQSWLNQIHCGYFPYWRWAQGCANAYRDLYQGAYISISLLGLAAVGGALLGALNPAWSTPGKWAELCALTTLLLLWHRARSRRWRQGWLGYRVLEEQIGQAAVLALLGRTPPALNSPTLTEFRREGLWFEGYLRAVMRKASVPAARLDQASLAAAAQLILTGLIGRQLRYYETAIEEYRRADERLERIAVGALGLTFLTAALYLFVHYFAERAWHWPIGAFRQIALGAGIFFPAMAATLAAIRTQSEFVQLATRYKGMCAHLLALRQRLGATLAAAQAGEVRVQSARIALDAQEAIGAMLDEVSHWRGLLYTHEIER